ncbi:MAG: hypothetical protein AB7K24_22155 [Gemmataceae bacterium]
MSRRGVLKLFALLATLGLSGCSKPAEEQPQERPLPKDRLPPNPDK